MGSIFDRQQLLFQIIATLDMGSVGGNDRAYPLTKPPGHRPPVPRWTLKLPDCITHVYTIYTGVQHHKPSTKVEEVEARVESIFLAKDSSSTAYDVLRTTNGFDLADTKVWVAYYTHQSPYKAALSKLDLVQIWHAVGVDRSGVGLWIEHFGAPVDRLETNYSRLDHKPGLAQIPNVKQPAHELTAYWGAGRDRIPASAHDLFATPSDIPPPPSIPPRGLGQRLTGSNYDNMCHIRSGQWWEKCEDEERAAYEQKLQATLMQGMNYLWGHAEETGTIGLRFLQNLDTNGNPIKETCGAGFHRNWADLERWSSRHPSHLAIFNGAIEHARKFGEARRLMTWHEVWILKASEAQFEYVNCDPKTGLMKWLDMQAETIT